MAANVTCKCLSLLLALPQCDGCTDCTAVPLLLVLLVLLHDGCHYPIPTLLQYNQ